jgi:pimeloyl-ACP methyl ester carboxylesterase
VRFRILLAVGVLVIALGGAPAVWSSQIMRVEDLGNGSGEAWLYLPAEHPPSCAVVYLHGAGHLTPGPYQPWLVELTLGNDCAVVFPRYQLTARSPALSAESVRNIRAGAAASFAYLRKARFGLYGDPAPAQLPVVVAGYADGAVLAMYYAANAKRWGLTVPFAVDSIFPSGGQVGAPLAPLPRSTRVLIQVGDDDRAGGINLWRYLASHPANRKHLQIVHAVHTAPLQSTAASENVFWSPLDTLIDRAKG